MCQVTTHRPTILRPPLKGQKVAFENSIGARNSRHSHGHMAWGMVVQGPLGPGGPLNKENPLYIHRKYQAWFLLGNYHFPYEEVDGRTVCPSKPWTEDHFLSHYKSIYPTLRISLWISVVTGSLDIQKNPAKIPMIFIGKKCPRDKIAIRDKFNASHFNAYLI